MMMMMMMMLIFILLNFLISAFSDMVLNYLSTKSYSSTTIQSLRPYFRNKTYITSAFYAGVTVICVLLPTMIFSTLLFGFSYPISNYKLLLFILLAAPFGFIADNLIYKLNIFGKSLNAYYRNVGIGGTAGIWGMLAFIFSIVISYFCMCVFAITLK